MIKKPPIEAVFLCFNPNKTESNVKVCNFIKNNQYQVWYIKSKLYICTRVKEVIYTANFKKERHSEITAKIKMKALNPYKVTWLVLTPNLGKAIKKDLQILNKKRFGFVKSNNEIKDFFANKELALNFAKQIVGLTKEYKVTFITDKQFGLSKWNESLLNVATTKQKLESFNI